MVRAGKKEPAHDDPGLPPQGVRTAVTLLLMLHLFALFAAVVGNFGAISPLQSALLNNVPVVQPYLDLLHLNTAHDFAIIYGTDEDWDPTWDIVLNRPENYGGGAEEVAQLERLEKPLKDIWPGMRRRRYWMLAYYTAAYADDEDLRVFLPAALAGGMLREHKVAGGTHVFRSRRLRPLGRDFDRLSTSLHDPYNESWYVTVYEANLLPSGDEWRVVTLPGRRERTQSRSGSGGSR